ncbi:nucleotide pyrophosphatase/phosphodiesterase family protein [Mycolicibacter sp. MYC123]|uniref:Nucleotide pyrophosphatase/phosphodiesterase family protein n=1 Tax=[Mycobacterium] zoologicum TaxID=2872311 RepID=A0ABU5YMT2_9MYCO|nr:MULTISPECIES: nucleotide pyrophosphatase/phosphodiesterase family protein [unclassified Mycolicibacter]MEB3050018.1 nucleotide pyrophosphatase/phosphodiesterase family protein [Mycolicibacter sp. MYC123]MEB3062382.1 nucleotide pyrophosphatase/phosphodiesterase family protein [Mycolicibacter sp. MYC101]
MPGSICDILPSAAAVLGVPEAHDVLGLTDRIGDVRRVAVVLVDGLGYHLLPQLAAHQEHPAPLLASVLAGDTGHLTELTCTFPSTTPTSLVSLGTGVEPGEHGVLGFTVNVPGTDRVLTHILWRDDPPPATWQPVPTWFERLGAAGVGARAVLPEMFVGSGLTESAYRGAEFHPTAKGTHYAAHLAEEIAAAPGLIYGYTAALDHAAHLSGIGSPHWHAAAAKVDALLRHLIEELPGDAALVVTADHGGLNVPDDARIDCDAEPMLRNGIRVIAGEPRVRYLHTEPGAAADVLAAWSELLAGRAMVHSREDAVAAGLFGPVREEHLARIGDVVVTCTGDTAILATDHEPPQASALVGFHGGLTPAETAIPLLTFTR